MKVLELGSGTTKTPDAIRLDVNPRVQPDILHDLNQFPYPFANDEFDRVIMHDVLEHVDDFVRVVEEVCRIAKPEAAMEVSGPFMSSINYFSDPTHRRAFTSRSFDYFIEGTLASRYNYSHVRLKLLSVEYDKFEYPHRRGLGLWLLRWANRNKVAYENRYAFIFPVYQIYFELMVLK